MGLTKGTSKGNQIKFVRNNKWVKIDTCYESLAEVICSRYLRLFKFSHDVQICNYNPVIINNSTGCCSDIFTKSNETVITMYRILLKSGTKAYYEQYDNIPDKAYEILINKGTEYYKDFGSYLSVLFLIDLIIRNDDRHTNNIAFIKNNNIYKPAPIFDNGSALYQDINIKHKAIECLNKFSTAKPFGITFEQQFRLSNYYFPVSAEIISNILDLSDIIFDNYPASLVNRCLEVLKYTTLKYFNTNLIINM